MSLYNQVCGNNPLFGIYARILETVAPIPPVPRFRDMYTQEVDGKPQIVLYTRTGGGNRDDYQDENEALAKHPLYVSDSDDDYDCTFASFVFSTPDRFAAALLRLHRAFASHPKGMKPREKFERSLNAIRGTEPEQPAFDAVEIENAATALAEMLPNTPSSLETALL